MISGRIIEKVIANCYLQKIIASAIAIDFLYDGDKAQLVKRWASNRIVTCSWFDIQASNNSYSSDKF